MNNNEIKDILLNIDTDINIDLNEQKSKNENDLYCTYKIENEEENKNIDYLKFFDEDFKKETLNKNGVLSIKDNIIFLVKYLSTSIGIFLILLLTTNYSAYINIAKSYIYSEQMEEQSNGLMQSINANKIELKAPEEKIDEIKEIVKKKEIRAEENERHKTEKKSNYSVKKLVNEVNKKQAKLDIEITPYTDRVVIPKIGKNIPLVEVVNQDITGPKELENIFMKELEKGVIRYPGSAKPGKHGNTFIFGHSSNFPWIKGDYNDVFALLDNVTYGDDIYVYYGQKKYTYKIKEKKVITPGDTEILKRNNNIDELTLMTCWPIGTTLNRLIVIGEIVEE